MTLVTLRRVTCSGLGSIAFLVSSLDGSSVREKYMMIFDRHTDRPGEAVLESDMLDLSFILFSISNGITFY